jgi:hypothetical protein
MLLSLRVYLLPRVAEVLVKAVDALLIQAQTVRQVASWGRDGHRLRIFCPELRGWRSLQRGMRQRGQERQNEQEPWLYSKAVVSSQNLHWMITDVMELLMGCVVRITCALSLRTLKYRRQDAFNPYSTFHH